LLEGLLNDGFVHMVAASTAGRLLHIRTGPDNLVKNLLETAGRDVCWG
jgi:hypothetical protein